MTEFDLIRRYFTLSVQRDDVVLGVGDDAALLRVPAGQELAVTTDTLVAGVHFPPDTPAEAVGHKGLAVSLSDLAAMGAAPAWATLALTLPEADEQWLEGFSHGLHRLALRHGVALVGGDTTRGPLSVTIQAMGLIPSGQALRRGVARIGDGVYVTGTLGDAALGLEHWRNGMKDRAEVEWLVQRLMRPEPRIETGLALLGLASAAIDISDGLAADLGHVLHASGVGAHIERDAVPLSSAFRAVAGPAIPWPLVLSGGDDYELLFTLPPEREPVLHHRLSRLDVRVTRIGTIVPTPGLSITDDQGRAVPLPRAGYDHFAQP